MPEEKSSVAIWKAGDAIYLYPQEIPTVDIDELCRTWFFAEVDSLGRIRLPRWFCELSPDSRVSGRIDTQKKAIVLYKADHSDGNIKLDGLGRMVIPQTWAAFLGIVGGSVCRVRREGEEVWIKKCDVFVAD